MMRRQQLAMLSVVGVALVCAAALASAASLNEPNLPEANNLLKLIEMVNGKQKLTVEDVLAGYRDYVRLYEMQSDLAASHEAAGLSGESRYELIGKVLQTEGLGDIADTLFAPFNGSVPKSSLSGNMRTALLKAIEEISAQW